jgi:O-methyltransferase involved in polyketide biosynthesis
MLISATSALVLNWTSKEIWQSGNALDYMNSLDLTEGETLYKEFDAEENFMLTQAVTNRKYFVRKHTLAFLDDCRNEHSKGQVIILAAGISPLSVEIASFFPENLVFDLDKYSMHEKEKYLNNICPNIRFIECDITNTALLKEKLSQYGWNPALPTLVVIEGIVYYLSVRDLKAVLTFFAGHQTRLIADFVLKPEYVNEKTRIFGIDVFRKIKESVGLDFVNFYAPDEFLALLKDSGFTVAKRFTMDEIQLERTGKKEPFDLADSGWVSLIKH